MLRLIAAAVRLQKRELYRTYNQNGSHSLAIAPIVLTCSPEESHRLVSYTYMHVTDTSSLLGQCIMTQIAEGNHYVLDMDSQTGCMNLPFQCRQCTTNSVSITCCKGKGRKAVLPVMFKYAFSLYTRRLRIALVPPRPISIGKTEHLYVQTHFIKLCYRQPVTFFFTTDCVVAMSLM